MLTRTPSRPRVVASDVSTTYSASAGMATGRGVSVRTKTMPWFTGAGSSHRFTGVPQCRPTPWQRMGSDKVRWLKEE